jgi:hypothetical protein
MNNLLRQLALNSSTLLPDDLSAAILAGNTPPVEEIVMALIIGCMDAHAVTIGDPQSSWNDRRNARLVLAAAFLSALAVVGKTGEPTRT